MNFGAWLLSVDWLDLLDHIASIMTAAVAVWAWWQFGLRRRRNRSALENYLNGLRGKPQWGTDKGQRTIVHLMAELRQTEAEIIEGAFSSRKVQIIRVPDPRTGLAAEIMISYKDNG
ncbi:hypothetical protein NHF48_019605 [Sphingomonas sp. H160509]|uniref:hypothetical protein n=1 Tax=Sphingomonas sp. H160509 TaxID=2955313 RepID=UPI002096BABD|nr:hypothetical protein [Sphingomonas sp. H160509]MDD1452624.1 hypothetical protein [Sphingomonas sp. H160509]